MRELVLLLLVVGGAGAAQGAESSGEADLAKAIGVPALDRVGRIAVAGSGRDTADAAAVRQQVAAAFAGQGHDVILVGEPWPDGVPERVRLQRIWSELHALAVAVVRLSTPFDREAASVVLYDLGGSPLFQAFARRDDTSGALIWTAKAIVDPRKLPGPAFYRELGRVDLARRYQTRKIGKIFLAIGGGAVIVGSAFWQLIKAMASIDSSDKPKTTFTEEAIFAGGCLMMLSPILIRTDPLSDGEREALGGWQPRINIAAAPTSGGGMLSLAGQF